jgi:signal transduction histidine kinase
MLHEFLLKYEIPILALAAEKVFGISEARPTTFELEKGLPLFYADLIELLKKGPNNPEKSERVKEDIIQSEASGHGKESLRLGYTISQVVHGYGAICQSITEYAHHKETKISAWEFHELNLSLDVAIADAVTTYEEVGRQNIHQEEVLRLGELAHELRNILTTISIAHQMIARGSVGVGGSTSKLLSNAILRMGDLIDKSLSEVRLENAPKADLHRMRLIEAVGDVEATSLSEANSKGLRLNIDVDPHLEVNVDRHLLVSALANLVRNAIKFTIPGGEISLRGKEVNGQIVLEVEDQCGGLPDDKIEELFTPYTQKGDDKTGLGLGLTISRRAVILNEGTLSVLNLKGKGCVFTITLPQFKDSGVFPVNASVEKSNLVPDELH